jgi:hypothetical protein
MTALAPNAALALFNTLSHEQRLKIMKAPTRLSKMFNCPEEWTPEQIVAVVDLCMGISPKQGE